ncbi:hypothetical protein GCM10009646_79170 [Streptomyces aureus]
MVLVPLVDAVRSLTDSEVDQTADASIDALLTQLSNERRRLVTHHVHNDLESDEAVTVRELAEYIAHYENDDGYTSDDRKAVYVGLWQCHLSKLTDAGILEQVDTHEFVPGPNAAAAVAILDTAESVTGGAE